MFKACEIEFDHFIHVLDMFVELQIQVMGQPKILNLVIKLFISSHLFFCENIRGLHCSLREKKHQFRLLYI